MPSKSRRATSLYQVASWTLLIATVVSGIPLPQDLEDDLGNIGLSSPSVSDSPSRTTSAASPTASPHKPRGRSTSTGGKIAAICIPIVFVLFLCVSHHLRAQHTVSPAANNDSGYAPPSGRRASAAADDARPSRVSARISANEKKRKQPRGPRTPPLEPKLLRRRMRDHEARGRWFICSLACGPTRRICLRTTKRRPGMRCSWRRDRGRH
jgi:hypothetical protein